jgi:hypothetical protein
MDEGQEIRAGIHNAGGLALSPGILVFVEHSSWPTGAIKTSVILERTKGLNEVVAETVLISKSRVGLT